jgi:hypothetical protein
MPGQYPAPPGPQLCQIRRIYLSQASYLYQGLCVQGRYSMRVSTAQCTRTPRVQENMSTRAICVPGMSVQGQYLYRNNKKSSVQGRFV